MKKIASASLASIVRVAIVVADNGFLGCSATAAIMIFLRFPRTDDLYSVFPLAYRDSEMINRVE